MNKKIFGITILFVTIGMLITPVLASPTKGQKVPITIHFTQTSSTMIEEKITGKGIIHRVAEVTYDIVIDLDGVLGAYTGTAVCTRTVVINPKVEGLDLVLNDDYVMSFGGGTFEGQAIIVLQDYTIVEGIPDYVRGKAHALLIGAGAFEGQTINAGHKWVPFGPITWSGYLLQK